MDQQSSLPNRRCFLTGAALTAGLFSLNLAAQTAETKPEKDSGLFVIGPKPGYTPQVGTLVSMLTYIQTAVTSSVKGLTMADLDYLFDANANTIRSALAPSRCDRDLLWDEYFRKQEVGRLV